MIVHVNFQYASRGGRTKHPPFVDRDILGDQHFGQREGLN